MGRRTQSLSNLTVAALSERLVHLQILRHKFIDTRLPSLSLRGAKRRGNLGKAVAFSPGLSCYPPRYCEIATAPLGPRNDSPGSLMPLNPCRKYWQPAWRLLSAATDATGAHHFIDSPVQIAGAVPGAACRSPTTFREICCSHYTLPQHFFLLLRQFFSDVTCVFGRFAIT